MILIPKLRDVHRAVGLVCTLLLCGVVCFLLIYALILEAGDIVTSDCKRVGFYNYCLTNETGTGCYCILHLEDLRKEGIAFPQGLLVPLVLIYSSLVIFLIETLTLGFAMRFNERALWMFTFYCNAITLVGISLGLLMYLGLTMVLIDLSKLSTGFVALLMAIVGLAIISFITRYHVNQTQENPKTMAKSEDQIYTLIT